MDCDVINSGKTQHVTRDDTRHLLDFARKLRDPREGFSVDDPALVDDAEHDNVRVQREFLFHLIVILPDRGGYGEHVLRVSVYSDLGELEGEGSRQKKGHAHDDPGVRR